MNLHNIIFAKINDGWKVSWIEGDAIGYRNLYWYEWPYLYFIRIRNYFYFAGVKGSAMTERGDNMDASINTDKTLFTETAKDWKDEGYMPSIFVTKEESIGMRVGGYVIVMPISKWFAMAKQNEMLKDLG